MDGVRRRGVAAVARPGRRARLQLLRHGVGLWRRTQRAAARRAPRSAIRGKRLYIATKIPPKNRKWPARPEYPLDDVFPADYIREYTETSLRNLGLTTVDLQQFHVWDDAWATDDRWQRAIGDLKEDGLVSAIGISINRWEPANVLKALGTGLIDSVQVVYNIFDQAPEDELFAECRERNIAVIARVPFDEGSLTGTLTRGHDVAGRRLAQHLLPAREPERHARRASTRCDRSCRRA